MSAPTKVLTATDVDALQVVGRSIGLSAVGAVALDDPRFEPARAEFDRHLEAGRHGEMEFMVRSAAVRRDPAQMLSGARSALVVVAPYRGSAGPLARYAQSSDYHTELHRRLETLTEALVDRLGDVGTLICVDTKPLLERTAAVLAGHGFIGKHGCVIVPGLGSYLLLGEILCTAEWKPDVEPTATEDDLSRLRWDACGACTRCLDACPTDAFEAPGVLDPRRCISYLTIEHRGPIEPDLADRIGERVAGCDVCQEVCPYNGSSKVEARVGDDGWLPDAPPGSLSASLVQLANIRSGRYRAFVRGTALRRIPRRAMRRNALLALGNRSAPLSAEEIEAAEVAKIDPEPQISAAAERLLKRRSRG